MERRDAYRETERARRGGGGGRGAILEAILEHRRPFLELWGLSGGYWGPLGALLGRLGAMWGAPGAVLGLSWGSLGSSGAPPGAILEAIDQRRGVPDLPPRPSGAIKIASWALLGRSWALLGPSWGPLGPLSGLSLAILGPS